MAVNRFRRAGMILRNSPLSTHRRMHVFPGGLLRAGTVGFNSLGHRFFTTSTPNPPAAGGGLRRGGRGGRGVWLDKPVNEITEEDLRELLSQIPDDPEEARQQEQFLRLLDTGIPTAQQNLEGLPLNEDGTEIRFQDLRQHSKNPIFRKFLRHFTRASQGEGVVPREVRIRSDRILLENNFRARSNQNTLHKNYPLWYVGNRMAVESVLIKRVLREVRRRIPNLAATPDAGGEPRNQVSILDYGSLTSPGLWAAVETFGEDLAHYTIVEEDPDMAKMGSEFTAGSPCSVLYSAKLSSVSPRIRAMRRGRTAKQGDGLEDPLLSPIEYGATAQHSIVLGNNTLSKHPPTQRRSLLDELWSHVQPDGVLVLLEPGTPEGFHNTRIARQYLLNRYANRERYTHMSGLRDERFISTGAHVLAPCPHDRVCPLSPEFVPGRDLRKKEAEDRKSEHEAKVSAQTSENPDEVQDVTGLFEEDGTNPEEEEADAEGLRTRALQERRKKQHAHLGDWMRTSGGVNRICIFGERIRKSSLPNRSPQRLIPGPKRFSDMISENFSYVVIRKGPREENPAPMEVPRELVVEILSSEQEKLMDELEMQNWREVDDDLQDYDPESEHSDVLAAMEEGEMTPNEDFETMMEDSESFSEVEDSDTPEGWEKLNWPRVVIDATKDIQHWPRLLGPVLKRKGHVVSDVCTPQGFFERKTLSKVDGRQGGYQAMRKSNWGDTYPYSFPKQLKGSNHPEGLFSTPVPKEEREAQRADARSEIRRRREIMMAALSGKILPQASSEADAEMDPLESQPGSSPTPPQTNTASGKALLKDAWTSDLERLDRGHGETWRFHESLRKRREAEEAKRAERRARRKLGKGVPRGTVKTKDYTA